MNTSSTYATVNYTELQLRLKTVSWCDWFQKSSNQWQSSPSTFSTPLSLVPLWLTHASVAPMKYPSRANLLSNNPRPSFSDASDSEASDITTRCCTPPSKTTKTATGERLRNGSRQLETEVVAQILQTQLAKCLLHTWLKHQSFKKWIASRVDRFTY